MCEEDMSKFTKREREQRMQKLKQICQSAEEFDQGASALRAAGVPAYQTVPLKAKQGAEKDLVHEFVMEGTDLNKMKEEMEEALEALEALEAVKAGESINISISKEAAQVLERANPNQAAARTGLEAQMAALQKESERNVRKMVEQHKEQEIENRLKPK